MTEKWLATTISVAFAPRPQTYRAECRWKEVRAELLKTLEENPDLVVATMKQIVAAEDNAPFMAGSGETQLVCKPIDLIPLEEMPAEDAQLVLQRKVLAGHGHLTGSVAEGKTKKPYGYN
jgi:hypothetical protein